MQPPLVSIILPVFNAALFLEASIKSILRQTMPHFELLVINDGSTDNSEEIINKIQDERIIYIKNQKNEGLVYSLNKGIRLSKGKYIARMDADDIAIEQRIQLQLEYLESNKHIGILSTFIHFINSHDEVIGEWSIDKQAFTPDLIRRVMMKDNCISHPSVMIRSELLKELLYKEYQAKIEDYDLWLRALNQGVKIDKLNKPLLLYRIHNDSITINDRKKTNVFLKLAKCKLKFVYHETVAGKPSIFVLNVFIYGLLNLLQAFGKALKKLLNN